MNGILNIYKEQDYTSHDVVARLRGILHTKKAGHTGTLDPMAEGVLPVCVGAATKLCDSITGHDKEYEAVMILGQRTDTLDVTGEVLETREVMSTESEVREVIFSFMGGYEQTPPMYSAKKIGGKKLCDLAREGKIVERKPVFVDIYDIKILDMNLPKVRIRVSCGKGTYIRSLIDDIGTKLSCGAVMSELVRTKVGRFAIKEAYKLSEVEKMMDDGTIDKAFIGLESFFDDLDPVYTDGMLSKLLRNGNVFTGRDVRKLLNRSAKDADGAKLKMYDQDKVFAGVYEYDADKDLYRPWKMFLN